jgi:hypothetical protein
MESASTIEIEREREVSSIGVAVLVTPSDVDLVKAVLVGLAKLDSCLACHVLVLGSAHV